ncbi:conserved hypothetical protein [Trichormus variabilis ATCC 29413]|uniref:Uncharacterized protein n=2 Tax=Anabaena variabilis TaxID=264691 RepID=Q3M5T6_TRIV2|nr:MULTISPECIES: hypothetical protein [Nostocaceae]ABA23650.1 conserved hypothetical protein [Trichormus variabilis ATCC 29413]
MMLTEETLVEKFTTVVKERCPELSAFLPYCHVELVNSYWGKPQKLLQYFVIFAPHQVFATVTGFAETFRSVAEDMGIANAICMDATRIIRDRCSTLKQKDPILWLELQFLVSQYLEH